MVLLIIFVPQIHGNATFRIPLSDIKKADTSLENHQLLVDVIVTETLTQISINSSNALEFYSDPEKMEYLDSNKESFIPGFIYTAQVSGQCLRTCQPLWKKMKIAPGWFQIC